MTPNRQYREWKVNATMIYKARQQKKKVDNRMNFQLKLIPRLKFVLSLLR